MVKCASPTDGQVDSGKRGFLRKMAAVGAGTTVIPIIPVAAEASTQPARRPGMPGVRYGMVIDVRKCIGCQACTVSCSIENAPPIGQFRTTVLQYEVDFAADNNPAMFSLPRLCNHCENPPCVPVCPVQATFQREDGIVLVDNERCVGCGYCVQACPYDARFINHETQTADKCTFCEHRLEAGLLPACVETCVGGARVSGNLLDPDSEVSRLIEQNRDDIKVLKPDQGTAPHVFYIGLPDEFIDGIDGQASVRLLAEEDNF
ncbi:sulfate reduction electron transfer complex DsrMKJOP subunit DsrO [Orrella sp. 11846]|uniref:sulfate reduction electron transfer complex DsrMKJOP subunit DsrO n=1 Tax=Orrella sp. 11846 TaxID=3409913 RepID=UPI003B5BC721